MTAETPTWTRGQLKANLNLSDEQVDAFLAEVAEVAKSVGRENPVTTVGTGDEQMIYVEPAFAKLMGLGQ